jgi:hypothetical protein
MMKGALLVALIGVTAAACGGVEAQRAQNAVAAVIEVHKDPTCGCCTLWVDHLRSAGFTVNVTDNDDMAAFKTQHGVPRQAQSCHTAVVDGYVVEGHVPAADIQRLLRDRPAVAGLAVPGMPIGSPGMEVPGMAPQPFDTLTVARDGSLAVFASHNQ